MRLHPPWFSRVHSQASQTITPLLVFPGWLDIILAKRKQRSTIKQYKKLPAEGVK
jgi:hypothetical protein